MKLNFARTGFLPALLLVCTSGATIAAPQKFSGTTPLEWSVRLADSEMARRGDAPAWKPDGRAKWDYSVGLFTLSLLELNGQVDNPHYVTFTTNVIGSFITVNGEIQTYQVNEYQLDALNSGKTALALWQLTRDGRYQKAAALLRKQLVMQPRTLDGGFWHKQRYTNQMWLDGIYMAGPFY